MARTKTTHFSVTRAVSKTPGPLSAPATWSKSLASGPPQARPYSAEILDHWTQDPDLAGIRDVEALAKLPAEEQKAFIQLWANRAELLKKAETRRELAWRSAA